MLPYYIGGPGLGHALGLAGAGQDRQQGELAHGKSVKLPVRAIPGHPVRHLNLRRKPLRGQQSAQGLPMLIRKHLNLPP
jgi:hypothetical protein